MEQNMVAQIDREPIRSHISQSHPRLGLGFSHVARNGVLIFTLSRLASGVTVALLVAQGTRPVLSLILLLTFAVTDLLDGELARKLKVESPLRKAIDASIDRVVVLACFIAAWRVGELALIPVLVQFITATILALSSLWLLVNERRVVHGPRWHRVWSLSSLCTGIFVLLDLRGTEAFALLSALAAVVTVLDLIRRQHSAKVHVAVEIVR
jgi:phosphatidylglycerophosphate synthase